jgi:hypothetical protein
MRYYMPQNGTDFTIKRNLQNMLIIAFFRTTLYPSRSQILI